MKNLFAIALVAGAAASATHASGPGEAHDGTPFYLEGGMFTYEAFEASVTHADLEGCPKEFDPQTVFCRIVLANDQAHVFVFSYDGDQPLLAIKPYGLGDGFLPF